ncbi:hypothetical protein IC582_003556 [Cucumis melo]
MRDIEKLQSKRKRTKCVERNCRPLRGKAWRDRGGGTARGVEAPRRILRRKIVEAGAGDGTAREGEETQVLISPSHCDYKLQPLVTCG